MKRDGSILGMAATEPKDKPIGSVERHIDVLEQALLPFARLAQAFEGRKDAGVILSTAFGELTAEDFRRAAKALA